MAPAAGHEDDDFDDLPETELDDDGYDRFLAREFDAAGRLRDGPPVVRWILLLLVLAVVAALAVAL